MTKRFSWEADRASLILRVEDGDKKTEWKLRKSTGHEVLREIFEGIQLALWEGKPMRETTRAAKVEEDWETHSSTAVQASTEDDSRAAQAAYVAQLNNSAKWWDSDEDESELVALLPDYDNGEI